MRSPLPTPSARLTASAAVWVLVGVILASCSDGLTAPTDRSLADGPAAVLSKKADRGITIEVLPAAAELAVGEIVQLETVVTTPSGQIPPSPPFQLSTSDPTVAAVDDQGLVTAVAVGSAVVTASLGSIAADAEITVVEPAQPVTITWLNCMNGQMTTQTSLTSETLGEAKANAAPYLGIPAPDLGRYLVGTRPGGSALDESRTIEELGLPSGVTLYLWY